MHRGTAKALGLTRCGWMPALRPRRFLLFPRLGLSGEVVELFHASTPPLPALPLLPPAVVSLPLRWRLGARWRSAEFAGLQDEGGRQQPHQGLGCCPERKWLQEKSTRSAVPQAAGPAFPDLGPFPASCSSWFLLREAQASAALISGRRARPTVSYSRSEPDSGAHYKLRSPKSTW